MSAVLSVAIELLKLGVEVIVGELLQGVTERITMLFGRVEYLRQLGIQKASGVFTTMLAFHLLHHRQSVLFEGGAHLRGQVARFVIEHPVGGVLVAVEGGQQEAIVALVAGVLLLGCEMFRLLVVKLGETFEHPLSASLTLAVVVGHGVHFPSRLGITTGLGRSCASVALGAGKASQGVRGRGAE